jgi:hypothetical protein
MQVVVAGEGQTLTNVYIFISKSSTSRNNWKTRQKSVLILCMTALCMLKNHLEHVPLPKDSITHIINMNCVNTW